MDTDTHIRVADTALTQRRVPCPPLPLAVPNGRTDRILHVAPAVLDTGAPTTKTKGPEWDVRVASGRDEVEAAMDARVGDTFLPVDVDLLLQVLLILVIDELHDRLPAAGRPGLAEPVPTGACPL